MKISISPILLLFCCTLLFIGCGEDKKPPKKKAKVEKSQSKPKPKKATTIPTTKSGVQSSEMDPEKLEAAEKLIAATSEEDVAAVDAKKNYKKFCTSCHGFKGNAKINAATDLTKLKSSLTRKVAQIYFGKGVMTPFKGIMEDAEIIAVAKYIETLKK